MRVIILTSNKVRHKYMVNQICKKHEVVGIFSEGKQPKRNLAERAKLGTLSGADVIASYLREFEQKEQEYLLPMGGGDFSIPEGVPFFQIDPDRLNRPEVIDLIAGLRPDAFAVFGTSLVKRDLLDMTPHFVNIHLGLSPYYRGVATSFWPFFNNEPEYVGVTVFHLDEGIDSGPILHQGLVDFVEGDQIHDGSVKSIITGVKLQVQALSEIEAGTEKVFEQDLNVGRTYYNKDFTAEKLLDCLSRWDDKKISEYLNVQNSRKEKVRYIP
ncbi:MULTISPECIES: formyl transferase [Thalassospira]|uniref:formyl transferase n=1 Tax=Thalassospira TaxID=168934 RepID=UPI0007A472EC|nr:MULTISPECIES: formyl transferase [Thalassospira]KZB70943.1 hypothetical protein AUQ43_08845 [Thalassospira sp. MCCC 1A01148]MBR9899336.1 hypothetical protein [Rhodospirillales bacterium]